MPADPAHAAIAGRADAIAFLAGLSSLMAELEGVLSRETAHLAAGRIRAGLAEEAHKGALAAGYLRSLEHAKRHAVALARFSPAELRALRASSAAFEATVGRNQAVIATVRAVSEGLVRELGADAARRSRPSGYGPGAVSARPAQAPAAPLQLSARI